MSSVMDFHSHVLPGIDDGCANVEESIALLRMEAEQGIGRVVATPHFYAQHDTPERFLRRREAAEELLRNEMKKYPGLPKVSIGAEVYYFRGISDSEVISSLTIDGGDAILIEMPPAPWTDSMFRELEHIYTRRGLKPIVAHIDRYIRPFHTYRIPERLAELPVLIQANAEFFLRRSTASMAMRMLKGDAIHLLGSDCHNLNSRKPDLGEALKLIGKKLGDETISRISGYQLDVLDIVSV